MTLQVIGVGVGRTGTYSLKLAIDQLGLGPCHHMEEVLLNPAHHVPLWAAAVHGTPDWRAIYDSYESAVDWPTAGFFQELAAAYPAAKFVLTVRDPDRWVESFSETIYKLMAVRGDAPDEMQAWFGMAEGVIRRTGFPPGLGRSDLRAAFDAHIDAVKATVPADQLLIYQVKEGWEPLCAFLDRPMPTEPFPRSNDRGEFWDRVSGGT